MDLSALAAFSGFVVHYEAQVKENQSFSLSAGYQQFPLLLSSDNLTGVQIKTENNGYRLGADYRLYMSKENKYEAPHGIYWGPYFSYLNFSQLRDVEGT